MFEILVNGDYDPVFWQNFGVEEDNPLIALLLEISQTVRGWTPFGNFPRMYGKII